MATDAELTMAAGAELIGAVCVAPHGRQGRACLRQCCDRHGHQDRASRAPWTLGLTSLGQSVPGTSSPGQPASGDELAMTGAELPMATGVELAMAAGTELAGAVCVGAELAMAAGAELARDRAALARAELAPLP